MGEPLMTEMTGRARREGQHQWPGARLVGKVP